MKIRAVVNYKIPSYPTKEMVAARPELLKKVPQRWKDNLSMGIAVSVLTGVLFTSFSQVVYAEQDQSQTNERIFKTRYSNQPLTPMWIPKYISEDEAFSIVQEEAKKHGITFQRDIKSFDVQVLFMGKDLPKKEKLELDGYDPIKKIGFEFVSKMDKSDWLLDERFQYYQDHHMDLIKRGNQLVKCINDDQKIKSVGVFCETSSEFPLLEKQYGILDAKNELRSQVNDYFSWLKSQGII